MLLIICSRPANKNSETKALGCSINSLIYGSILYFIIVCAILAEYILSTLSSILNMNSIDEKVRRFEDYYDEANIRSQLI